MNEFGYMILLPASSLLWMLGGYRWKWMRRYLLPVIYGVVIAVYGRPVQALIVAVLSMVSFSLPYGDNSKWWGRVLTALSFGAVSLPLGFSWFQLLPPIVFLTGYYAKPQWKITEGATGFACALPIADMLYYTY